MSSTSIGLSDELHNYLLSHGVRESAPLAALRIETASLEMARMQISPEQGAFMAMMVQMLGAKRCIEVGTFTGYSALSVAQVLPKDGYLLACDVSDEWTSVGLPHWEAAGISAKVDLQLAPALDTLNAKLEAGEEGSYDFAFIDADKENYQNYFEACLKLIRVGGVIAVDNVLWGGNVIDLANQEESTIAIRELNKALAADKRVDISMVPIGDGLTLARKR